MPELKVGQIPAATTAVSSEKVFAPQKHVAEAKLGKSASFQDQVVQGPAENMYAQAIPNPTSVTLESPTSTRNPAKKDKSWNNLFVLPDNASKETKAQAARILKLISSILGPCSIPSDVLPLKLDRGFEADLERLAKLLKVLEKNQAVKPDSVFADRFKNGWLRSGFSPAQLFYRISVASCTGYMLEDQNPYGGAQDSVAWNDEGLALTANILLNLPPNLTHVEGLYFIVRDARSEEDARLLEQSKSNLDDKKSKGLAQRLLGKLVSVFVSGLNTGNMGATFGQAIFAGYEIRLFNELFSGAKTPGLSQMLAFTLIHEIGHFKVEDDELKKRWLKFWNDEGQRDAPYPYAKKGFGEGFAVALGMYAVTPELLKEKSPKTYEFLKTEFGSSLDSFHGDAWEELAVKLTYGSDDFIDKIAKLLGSGS